MTKIQLNGISLTIAFNMASQIGFEEISGKPFSQFDENSSKDTIQLATAVIIANNPDTEFKTDWLMRGATAKEIVELTTTIYKEMEKWAGVPNTLPDEEDKKDEEEPKGEEPKND